MQKLLRNSNVHQRFFSARSESEKVLLSGVKTCAKRIGTSQRDCFHIPSNELAASCFRIRSDVSGRKLAKCRIASDEICFLHPPFESDAQPSVFACDDIDRGALQHLADRGSPRRGRLQPPEQGVEVPAAAHRSAQDRLLAEVEAPDVDLNG